MIVYKDLKFGGSFKNFGGKVKNLGAASINLGTKLIKSGGLKSLGSDSLILRVQLIMFLKINQIINR